MNLLADENISQQIVDKLRLTTLPPTEEAELAAMVINEYGERLLKAFTVITTRGIRIHPV